MPAQASSARRAARGDTPHLQITFLVTLPARSTLEFSTNVLARPFGRAFALLQLDSGGSMAKRSNAKRELIDTGRNKTFTKRDVRGRFKEMDDVGRSLAADRGRPAKRRVKSGYWHQGDRRTGTK